MNTALIIGVGSGLSASIARALHVRKFRLVLAARGTSDLGELARQTEAELVDCDASDPEDMRALFETVSAQAGPLSVAIYNPSARPRGPIDTLGVDAVRDALMVTAYGTFLMAHHAAPRMLANNEGTMLFTGASAGIKGFANSARSRWASSRCAD